MRVEEISNVEALGFVFWVLLGAYVLYRLIPGEGLKRPRDERYTPQEITAYDRALPKYAIVSLVALVISGAHAAIKSLPGLHRWLDEGGYGGHLVRDIANTHLMIVMGGTVAATAITWYVLPRVLQRPLFNERLAGASFWCTVIGAGGFYLVNVVTGLIAANQEHAGIGWFEANEAFGAWRAVPIGISATIMGIGYWTFVANVLATIGVSRRLAKPSPERHLAKFFAVGAVGLLIGTVQGVIQVMPSQEHWIQSAGSAGEYIDPIAHAHVNLVTGTLALVAGAALWWSRDIVDRVRQRRVEQRVFWLLIPASLAFYLTFMALGFAEGRLIVDEGLGFLEAVERLGLWHTVPLAVTGTLVLAGIWTMIAVCIARFRRRGGAAAGIIVAAMALLAVGTSQGLVQLVPPVKRWLERIGQDGDAIANAHAQLNMLGGVILALLGLMLLEADRFFGQHAPAGVVHRLHRRAVPGVLLYYVAAIATASAAGIASLHQGLDRQNLVTLFVGPLGMAAGAALLTAGVVPLAVHAWRATVTYREVGVRRFRHAAQRYDGEPPQWAGHVPWPAFVAMEFGLAIAGFPGFGWIISGGGLIGLPIALVGPAIAWGVVPVILSTSAATIDLSGPVAYLVASASLSAAALAVRLLRRERRWQAA